MEKLKGPGIAKTILKKKNRKFPIKSGYRAAGVKTVWCWNEARQINEWNIVRSPETNHYIYCRLAFDRNAQIIQW